MIDEDFAVQVVYFMLNTNGHEFVAFHFEGLSVQILSLDQNAAGTFNLFLNAGQRKAAFLARRSLFGQRR